MSLRWYGQEARLRTRFALIFGIYGTLYGGAKYFISNLGVFWLIFFIVGVVLLTFGIVGWHLQLKNRK